ncbi:uncharacterized protein LOC117123308 [Anneissia japonica]|uniref:uncharacterized protein LOC117123308 n=1 Tax=Anneissia japonica TaxID=1529436 RepID=UPI0014259AF7|nr:uncharacterized protein LOC117123308 [Anneissia japonica]
MAERVRLVNLGNDMTLQDVYELPGAIAEDNNEEFFKALKLLICKADSNVLKNAVVSIALKDSFYKLFTGNEANKFTIFRDVDNTVKVLWKDKDTWVKLWETAKGVFNWVVDTVIQIPAICLSILQLGAASRRLAITYFE